MGENLCAVLMTSFGLMLWANNPLLVLSATFGEHLAIKSRVEEYKGKDKDQKRGIVALSSVSAWVQRAETGGARCEHLHLFQEVSRARCTFMLYVISEHSDAANRRHPPFFHMPFDERRLG